MRLLPLLFVTLVLCGAAVHASEDAASIEEARNEALSKLEKPLEQMRVRELQALLAARGVECVACTEKHDVIERVMETIHLPVKEEPAGGEEPKVDHQTVEELLNRLKGSPGMEGMDFQAYNKEKIEEIMKQMKDGAEAQQAQKDEL